MPGLKEKSAETNKIYFNAMASKKNGAPSFGQKPFNRQIFLMAQKGLGNCEFWSKQKILFIYETKQDEILLKLKVKGQENFC